CARDLSYYSFWSGWDVW
nr:immunoglobulin heavy chain junction region [Macaca mulatta]MPN83397.1 immunoglobulin heavy chain junction region [Macaca mulatta]MPN83448.1 immunoglobulin heavy chain junction region [Macaca mulatta]MPN83468.1 immunoglobulin heavy chain junction region [Macaca mulatta]MPN83508.1 immunoglobulin heavy chain junction region [Macaca mulatta]